jgi:beta-lactamase class D
VPLAAVAFAAGLFASPETVIPWDGRPQRRAVVAADLTPRSYLELSANWVSERIVDRLGPDRVTAGLRALLPVSPPVTVTRPAEGDTVEGPVELTPEDQVAFWRRLWTGSLALPAAAREALLASLPRHRAGDLTVFGKTGTCCVDPGCESGPGRQLGWYVGVAEQGDLAYAFALRLTDLAPSRGYAGATARELVAALLPAVLTPLPAGNIGPGDGLSPDAPGPGAVN